VPLPSWRPLGFYPEAIRGAALVVLAVLMLRHHSKQTLGTNNLFRVAAKLPPTLLAAAPVTANPLARHDYWTGVTVDGNAFLRPLPHHWPVEEMLDEVARAVDRQDPQHVRPYRIGYVTDLCEFMSREFAYFKLVQMRLLGPLEFYTLNRPTSAGPAVPQSLLDADFLILKTGAIAKPVLAYIPEVRALQAFVDALTADHYRRLRATGFTLLKRYDLPDGSEGSVWQSPSMPPSSVRLLPRMSDAEITEPDHVAVTSFDFGGDRRTVLFQHAEPPPRVSEVRWKGLRLPAGGTLSFGITVHPSSWTQPPQGDGTEFLIDVVDGGRRTNLFRHHLDPQRNAAERCWHDFDIPLPDFEGREVELVLTTLPGPSGDNLFAQGAWSGLRVLPPTQEQASPHNR
jgi:hypothetical protein